MRRWLVDAWNDALAAWLTLRRAPLYVAPILLTLAPAMGGATALLSFVNTLVIERLPVPEPEKLALLSFRVAGDTRLSNGYSYAMYREIASRNSAFGGVVARAARLWEVETDSASARLGIELVSANYFSVLRVRPALGRLLQPEDEREDTRRPPAVISFDLWQSRLGGGTDVLGRELRVNGQPVQIVGVTEPRFFGTVAGSRYDVQIPASAAPLFHIPLGRTTWLSLMGRLKPGLSMPVAEAMTRAAAREANDVVRPGMNDAQQYVLEDGSRGFADVRQRVQSPALALLGAAALLLVIACINIAGLVFERSLSRRAELAVRLSLGATRGRLARQFLVENGLLALGAAGVGIVFAQWLIWLMSDLLDDGRSASLLTVRLDPQVLLLTGGAAVASALLIGLFPAWRAGSFDIPVELRGGATSTARRARPIRRLFVVAQVSFSLVLLYGACVCAVTLRNLVGADLGFLPRSVVLLTLDPEAHGYEPAGAAHFWRRLLADAQRSPGVAAATLSSVSVLSGDMIGYSTSVPGFRGWHGSEPDHVHIIASRYFAALGTPLLRGRDFEDTDDAASLPVAIVNERCASMYWPNQEPLGKVIQVDRPRQVVGVVKDAHYRAIREALPVTIYLPVWQAAGNAPGRTTMTLIARVRGNRDLAMAALRRAVAGIDAKLPVEEMRSLEAQLDQTIVRERILAWISGMFGALALLIVGVGLAAVAAIDVKSRTREIGIRMVLGARRHQIAAACIKSSLSLVAAGILVGLPAAKVTSRVLDGIVYGLPAWNPDTLASMAALLMLVCVVAVVGPLRRAVSVTPAVTLRDQ